MSAPDHVEIARFDRLAHRWWDEAGEMAMLHRMNPARLGYVAGRAALAGRRCLDVGCGGGILAEGLARHAGEVLGIDLARELLEVARLHAIESGLGNLRYDCIDSDTLATREAGRFGVVTCMEMLEHVEEPGVAMRDCARLAAPGGDVFFSTINRTPRAWAIAILGAEYVARLLPPGTHRFDRFLRPSELEAHGRTAGLELLDVAGLEFDVATRSFAVGSDVSVNFLAHFRRGTGAP
jgi:2-polyprenyl-6-hydroxyphenyl methylase/3-demethylubiquinone-9 3-methyltransferase